MRGGRISRITLEIFAIAALVQGMVVTPAAATILTSSVTDPIGDAVFDGSPAPAYNDIASASIALIDGNFVFQIGFAGQVPAVPVLPNGVDHLSLFFGLDTNKGLNSVRIVFGDNGKIPYEFGVQTVFSLDGAGLGLPAGWVAILVNVTGPTAIVTQVPLVISGSTVRISVNSGLIGNPSTFRWLAATEYWLQPWPTTKLAIPDVAPDPPTCTFVAFSRCWAGWPS